MRDPAAHKVTTKKNRSSIRRLLSIASIAIALLAVGFLGALLVLGSSSEMKETHSVPPTQPGSTVGPDRATDGTGFGSRADSDGPTPPVGGDLPTTDRKRPVASPESNEMPPITASPSVPSPDAIPDLDSLGESGGLESPDVGSHASRPTAPSSPSLDAIPDLDSLPESSGVQPAEAVPHVPADEPGVAPEPASPTPGTSEPTPSPRETTTPQNQSPTAGDASTSSSKNAGVVRACVLQKAKDPDGDTIVISSIGTPDPVGVVSVGSGIAKYSNCDQTVRLEYPDDWTGVITVPFVVSDGRGGTDQATLTVTIENRAPDAKDDDFGSIDDENGSAATEWTLPVLCNDSDADGDVVEIISATSSVGTVTVSSDSSKCNETRNVLVWKAGGYLGAVTLRYTISDGEDTASATVRLCAEDPVNPVYCP